MEKTINITELASELAGIRVREQLVDYDIIYNIGKNGYTSYTKQAQALFDLYYDHYYSYLEAIPALTTN
jgi:hypothetical protein